MMTMIIIMIHFYDHDEVTCQKNIVCEATGRDGEREIYQTPNSRGIFKLTEIMGLSATLTEFSSHLWLFLAGFCHS